MSDELLRLNKGGYTYSQIAAMTGMSRSAVAGAIYRTRHPYQPGKGHEQKGFRDIDFVRRAVARAEEIGLCRAADEFGLWSSQLCRWRQALRKLEGAA